MRILVVCADPAIDTYVWLDTFTAGGVNRATREQRFPGGKGTHVAMALRELGADVCLVGPWLGPTGAWISEQCLTKGIEIAGPITDGFARTCITFRGPSGMEFTELRGCSDAPDDETVRRVLAASEQALGRADAVVISGRWPSDHGPDICGRLVASARLSGVPVCVDCDGNSLKSALRERPDLIHVNEHEGAVLTGLADPPSIAHRLAASASLVTVSAGADGVYVANGSRLIHAVSPVDQVISTVGAGDCLTAGMVWGRLTGEGDLDTVARWSVACGAANCVSPDLGMLRRADVDHQLRVATLCAIGRSGLAEPTPSN
jgi:1-phosphofructokinase family hexose kinase